MIHLIFYYFHHHLHIIHLLVYKKLKSSTCSLMANVDCNIAGWTSDVVHDIFTLNLNGSNIVLIHLLHQYHSYFWNIIIIIYIFINIFIIIIPLNIFSFILLFFTTIIWHLHSHSILFPITSRLSASLPKQNTKFNQKCYSFKLFYITCINTFS